ncbi:hypothetical protein OQA88_6953 [Cercophora sp. LCS_1]
MEDPDSETMPAADIEFLTNLIAMIDDAEPERARMFGYCVEQVIAEENSRSVAQIAEHREHLRAMDDATLINTYPECKEVIEDIVEVVREKPGERIIIVAHLDAFFDTLTETLVRAYGDEQAVRRIVGRLNDDVTDKEMEDMARRLSDRSDDLGIVFLNPLSERWWGLNLSGASTIFLQNPIWSQHRYDRLKNAVFNARQTRNCVVCNCYPQGLYEEVVKLSREKSKIPPEPRINGFSPGQLV